MKIFLSFDFYGAGNIGDDLMLDGFLQGIENNNTEMYCSLPRNFSHQKLRFPQINFVDRNNRYSTAAQCPVWIGAGDTPIQIKSNDWFLKKLLRDSEFINDKNVAYFFIGIGAEKEAVMKKSKFMESLNKVNHIWTRDISTTEFLINELEMQNEKVSTSSDLANISLNKIFNSDNFLKTKNRKYDVGICYFDEDIENENLMSLRFFIKDLQAKKRKILIFGNEVKEEGFYEYRLYKKMFNPAERLFNKSIKYFQPDYFNLKSTAELVSHYPECDTIIASRYHALLTAAWAGCKVVSIERSSKVTVLAELLGIPEVKKPITSGKLFSALEKAKLIDRNILNSLLSDAEKGISGLNSNIRKFLN